MIIQTVPSQLQIAPNSRIDHLLCLKHGSMHKVVLCDVTVTHPVSASTLSEAVLLLAACINGFAGRKARAAKYIKYSALANCT